jgi:precorrin-6B methylase 2
MSDYTLAISEEEVARYRFMAEMAQAREAEDWTAAGIVPGAAVADVGCGPAAMSVVIANIVGPEGRVVAVERDPSSFAHAQQVVAAAGVSNVELHQGDATATGIEPGTMDVAMMRHVLAHNGGHEQDIVNHLASLVRPGGHVFLVDVDLSAVRVYPLADDLADLGEAYVRFHAQRGNDPMIGLRLGELLTNAGLVDVQHTGEYSVISFPPGLRPPAWAARDAMIAEGVVTTADVERWGAAFDRMDTEVDRPTLFAPGFIGVGRKPS